MTSAANKHVLTGRPFPASSGLDLAQMLGAIRELGYSPHVLKPEGQMATFQLALKCYVASGIPVILQIKPNDDDLHAVAVTGYAENRNGAPLEISVPGRSRVLRFRGMEKLYVHDDRLGPYARMRFSEAPETIEGWPYEDGFERFETPSVIWKTILPLYPKIRLTAEDLAEVALEVLPVVEYLAGQALRDQLVADLRFVLGGKYVPDLFKMGLSASRATRFAKTALLSRYVGIIRFRCGGDWFGDVVCDTTEILRGQPQLAPVIAIIIADEARAAALKEAQKKQSISALII